MEFGDEVLKAKKEHLEHTLIYQFHNFWPSLVKINEGILK